MVDNDMYSPGGLTRQEYLRWLLAVPLIALLLGLLVWLGGVNQSLFLWINGRNWPAAEPTWSAITLLGDSLTLVVVLLFFVGRRADFIWSVMVALVLVSVLLHFSKGLFAISRPPRVLDAEQLRTIGFVASNNSFPSGHTTAAFAFAGAICLLHFPRWLKWTALALAILAGFSRMVVGIHWPLDVLAGAATGWLGMALCIWLASLMPWGQGLWAQRVITVLLLLATGYALWGFDGGYPAARWVYVVLPLLALAVVLPRLPRLFGVSR